MLDYNIIFTFVDFTLYQDCYTHMVSSTVVELLYILYITVTIWGIPSVGIGIVGMVYVLGLF
jgi:hypothetical protein